jgi:hypothetical protein
VSQFGRGDRHCGTLGIFCTVQSICLCGLYAQMLENMPNHNLLQHQFKFIYSEIGFYLQNGSVYASEGQAITFSASLSYFSLAAPIPWTLAKRWLKTCTPFRKVGFSPMFLGNGEKYLFTTGEDWTDWACNQWTSLKMWLSCHLRVQVFKDSRKGEFSAENVSFQRTST